MIKTNQEFSNSSAQISGQLFNCRRQSFNKIIYKAITLSALISGICGQLFYCRRQSFSKSVYKAITISALISGICGQTFAQQINLQQAIDSALSNNLNVKNEKLKADYQKKIIQTGVNLPQTMINGEYGQINSVYNDNRFSIAQSLQFPTIYVRQKNALKAEWQKSLTNVVLKETELKKQVKQTFYQYLYLKQKQQLLQSNDSLYASFLSKSNSRFKAGESNVLEHATAENQRTQISVQLNQLNTDLELVLVQFQLLLNTNANLIPSNDNFRINEVLKLDSNDILNHPTIKLLVQQKQISLLNKKVEKSRLLPDLTLAYNNMTMQGMGADDVNYNTSKRFQSAQIGLGIPLFFRAHRAQIGASKIDVLINENRLQNEINLMKNEWNKAIAQYSNYLKTITIYESKTLNNAQLIIETANKQFANGDINYIEWVMLTNQAIAIKNEYLNGVYYLNESIIQLNYLSNK
jgi:cobalt-zinc-cadmium resistance protein CzcA